MDVRTVNRYKDEQIPKGFRISPTPKGGDIISQPANCKVKRL